jgi:Secretion system C-terminal sorting domain
MDITGKLIKSEKLNINENRKSFDISGLANGVYTAQVVADGNIFYIQKITINK